jgi:xylose isomerase
MERKYSVFIFNVGSASDRYCGEYERPFGYAELFDRVQSIPKLGGVDFVASPDMYEDLDLIKKRLSDSALVPVSVAVDTFTQAKWRQGSFSSIDAKIRQQAVDDTKRTMDLAAEMGCDQVTIWPGQDGYDYVMQADYMQERTWFAEGVREACKHNPDIKISIEYKLKEPRTHSYVSTVGNTILLVQEIGLDNCGVALDYGHALLGYENPAESVALIAKYGVPLMHIHINDNYRYWDDDMITGAIHVQEFLEFIYWLRRTGYDGWITFDQFPYRENGRDAVAESAEWLDRFEACIDNADLEEITAVLKQKDAIKSSRLLRKLIFAE